MDKINNIIYRYWDDNFLVWVSQEKMTDEEKTQYPSYKTTEGFLRTHTYKETWAKTWAKLDDAEKNEFYILPNFDAVVFEEITGIKVETI